ncbi:MAG: PhzF family phenazine biosynthesis protein [Pseudomonadota bacterium]
MPDYDFDWVDAFTDRPFAGNACMVIQDADTVSVDDRMRLVRETSLSECAYLVHSALADFGARYYLAGAEIPMAGHPTVATVAALARRGRIDLSAGRADITLEVGAGVLPVTVTGTAEAPVVQMTQAAPVFGADQDPAEIAAIYGLPAEAVVGRPQIVSTGTAYCITVLNDRAALEAARLDHARLADWRAGSGVAGADIMEPFLVTLGGATDAGDTYARLLLPPPNPAEDPFTGSATGCMAAYLWRHGLIDRSRFSAEQGHGMGRPGRAEVEVLGPRDDIFGVRVAGAAAFLMAGQVRLG